MSTETSYTAAQLAQIMSALENKARNPSSKAVALRAIERLAAQIGLSGDDVLKTADGLLSGRLSEADWRAQLSDAPADESEESPGGEAAGAGQTGADAPAVATTTPAADNQDGDPPASIDALSDIAATSALPAPGGTRAHTVKQQLLAACRAAERWLQAQHDPSEGGDEILGVLRVAIARAAGEPRQGEPGTPRQPRENTKEAQVIALLRQPQGATLAQIGALTGWQAHSIRGFFAGALKKRRGMQVISEKRENGARLYRLADGGC